MFEIVTYILVAVVAFIAGLWVNGFANPPVDVTSELEAAASRHRQLDALNASREAEKRAIELEKRCQLEQSFAEYRENVTRHLEETEQAIDTLTKGYAHTLDRVIAGEDCNALRQLSQSYQHVFTKLSESAKTLSADDVTLRHFDARRDKAVLINMQQRIKS